jgi:small subunit ribosomal protein S5e
MEVESVQNVKLFNKWTYENVEVKDLALKDYIMVDAHPVYLPHTAGRYQVKRFRKAKVI